MNVSPASATLPSPSTFAACARTSASPSFSSGNISLYAAASLRPIWPRPQMACSRASWFLSVLGHAGEAGIDADPFSASANCASCRTRMSLCSSSFASSSVERLSKPRPAASSPPARPGPSPRRIGDFPDPALVRLAPAVHPVADVEAAVRAEIHVGRQDRPDELRADRPSRTTLPSACTRTNGCRCRPALPRKSQRKK